MELKGGGVQELLEVPVEKLDLLTASLPQLATAVVHRLERKTGKVHRREREVPPTDGGTGTETVLKHTRTAAHRGNLMHVTLRVISLPVRILIVGSVEIEVIREKTARRDLRSVAVKVVVRISGEIIHSTLFLPNLNRENCGLSVTDTLIGGVQNLADDAAPFGRGIGTVVDGREDNLVAATAVDIVHVMDEGLHSLMDALDGPVNSLLGIILDEYSHELFVAVVLFATRLILTGRTEFVHIRLNIILGLHFQEQLNKILIDFLFRDEAPEIFGHLLHLLFISFPYKRSQVKIEGRNSLAAVHLVLNRLHRHTGGDGGRLDTLCRTRRRRTGNKAILQGNVERMLDTGKTLGRIIILVVDMQQICLHGIFDHIGKQHLVNIGLRRFRGELHHHTGRRVRIHIGVLAGDIVGLRLDDRIKDGHRVSPAGKVALFAVPDVFLSDFGARGLHQFCFHHFMNLVHGKTFNSIPFAAALGFLDNIGGK